MPQDQTSLHGPIHVEEISNQYLVRIHPKDKDLAKSLPGRSWDGDRKCWVWEKNEKNFSNLSKQFKQIAEKFNITKEVSRPKAPAKAIGENDLLHVAMEDLDASGNIVFPEFEEANKILRDLPPIEYEVFARLREIDQKLGQLLHDSINMSTTITEPKGSGKQLIAANAVEKPRLEQSDGQEFEIPNIVRWFSTNTAFHDVIDNIKRGDELQSPITQVFNQLEGKLFKNLDEKLSIEQIEKDPKAIKQKLKKWCANSSRWKNEPIVINEFPLSARELYLASDMYEVYAFDNPSKANAFFYGLRDVVRLRNEIHQKNVKNVPSRISFLKWYCTVAEAFDVLAQE